MTKHQIVKYDYCQKHLKGIASHLETLPFGIQKYGCGSNMPSIEHDLEKIHKEMYDKVVRAIKDARGSVQKIIDEI